MSPPSRKARRALAAFGIPFVVTLALLAATAAPAGAQEGGKERHFSISSMESGCPVDPCWDFERIPSNPGETLVLHVDASSGFHDFDSEAAGVNTDVGLQQEIVTIQIPDDFDGGWEYVCSVHPTSMKGEIMTVAQFNEGAAGHGEAVPSLGVNFLAYWVGVIAFAVLFIAYGATFFLFKYNETSKTTDQWDRGEESAHKGLTATSNLLAAVIAAVVIFAIVFLAR